jgi:hypothetical protein
MKNAAIVKRRFWRHMLKQELLVAAADMADAIDGFRHTRHVGLARSLFNPSWRREMTVRVAPAPPAIAVLAVKVKPLRGR